MRVFYDIGYEGKWNQLRFAPVQLRGFLGRWERKDYKAIGAEQVENERINDQNARAENGAVLMIIPGDVGNGKQDADRREKNERLAQRLGLGRHKITSVGFS